MASSLFQNFCTASSTKTTMFLSILGFPSVFCSPALTCSPRVPLALRRDFSRSRTISHLEACHAIATFSRSAPPLATLALLSPFALSGSFSLALTRQLFPSLTHASWRNYYTQWTVVAHSHLGADINRFCPNIPLTSCNTLITSDDW